MLNSSKKTILFIIYYDIYKYMSHIYVITS